MILEGVAKPISRFVRFWPRLRAVSVFFLPFHLPGVDAGGEADVELLLGDSTCSLVRGVERRRHGRQLSDKSKTIVAAECDSCLQTV